MRIRSSTSRWRTAILVGGASTLLLGLLAGLAAAAPTALADRPPPPPAQRWSTMTTTNPSTDNDSLFGVSCISASFCVAVGNGSLIGVGGSFGTVAEQWNGSTWSTMNTTDPGPGAGLTGVSCTSPRACVAVGGLYNGSVSQTLAEQWNGSTWSTMNTANPPNDGALRPNDGGPFLGDTLNAVSCTSDRACVAVGSSYNGSVNQTLAEQWNGFTWSTMNTTNRGAFDNLLNGVSCTSARACVAVGSSYNGFVNKSLAEQWNGSRWSTMNTTNPGTNDLLGDVSCTSARACVAVGSVGSFSDASSQTLAEQWDGSTWSTMNTTNSGVAYNFLNGVSCSSPRTCVAVGNNNNGSANQTLAEQWDGSTWSTMATTNPGAADGLFRVSCTSASVCVATGQILGTPPSQTLAEIYEGSPSPPPPPPPPPGPWGPH